MSGTQRPAAKATRITPRATTAIPPPPEAAAETAAEAAEHRQGWDSASSCVMVNSCVSLHYVIALKKAVCACRVVARHAWDFD